jgi:hypothetical protein
MSVTNYYMGWSGATYRTDLFTEPVPPANYRDPAKIAAYVAEQSEKRMAAAPATPFFGRLSNVVILDETGVPCLDVGDDVAAQFVNFLTDNFQFPGVGEYFLQGAEGDAQLVGCNLKDALKMAALEVLAINVQTQGPQGEQVPVQHVPLRMWYHRSYCVDPVSMLKGHTPGVDLSVISDFFNITQVDMTDATAQATFVRRLSQVVDLGHNTAIGVVEPADSSDVVSLQQV